MNIKISVAVACSLPGRAKDLSAPLVHNANICFTVVMYCSKYFETGAEDGSNKWHWEVR